MDYTVIGISGKRGSGKDTLFTQMAPLGWEKMSFAAELKARVRADFGLTEDQTDGQFKEAPTQYRRSLDRGFLTPRDVMVRCGFYFRDIDPMFWVKKVYQRMEVASAGCYGCSTPVPKKYVITDVRFKNEADYIKANGGFLVRLERDLKLNIYKGKLDDPSETELDDYEGFDVRVAARDNRTITDLKKLAAILEDCYGKAC